MFHLACHSGVALFYMVKLEEGLLELRVSIRDVEFHNPTIRVGPKRLRRVTSALAPRRDAPLK